MDFAPTFVFIVIGVFVEYLVVAYAMSLGVEDVSPLRSTLLFPGSNWTVTLALSPLFHVVPFAVIVALVASWTYLERHVRARPQEAWKGKASPPPKHGKRTEAKLTRLFGRIGPTLAKAKTKSAIIVLVIFTLFVLAASLLTFQQAIYRGAISMYQTNPSLLAFVRGTNVAMAPVGNAISALNGAAPGLRDIAVGVGNALKPLAELDGPGKYLVFQNAAAWLSALVVLSYVTFGHRSRQYRKK